VVTDHGDILALWSCAVGLTRWFDRDQAKTVTALRDSILDAVSPEGREEVADRLRRLTPGEFLREEYDKDRQESESAVEDSTSEPHEDDVASAVSELVRKTDVGHEPSLMEIGHLVMRVARDNPANRTELMSDLFALVDANRSYVTGWDQWGQSLRRPKSKQSNLLSRKRNLLGQLLLPVSTMHLKLRYQSKK